MVGERNAWTFKKLRSGQPVQLDTEGGLETVSTAQGGFPAWAIWVGLALMTTLVIVTSVGVAASLGAFSTPASPPPPPPPKPPPLPPPPFNSDDSTAQCNNDCLGCGINGGCTYSYGAGGAEHDARVYISNGVCDDGGPGSETSHCDLGSDCTDCGPRVIPLVG